MKNIKWTLNSYWTEQGNLRYLISVGSNFTSTVGAFVSAPVRNQSSEVILEKIPRKNIKY